jgi:hypothetical protein
MEIAILVTLIVGFIITWIACSKPATIEEMNPGSVYPIRNDYEKESLKIENYTLRRKFYDIEQELRYYKTRKEGWDIEALRRILERPVEVNVDVKVELDETNCKSSRR